MNAFADRVRARRRLEILLLLRVSAQYGASDRTLAMGVADRGVAASSDALAGDVAWLREQGLVDTESTESGTTVRATQRGLDVAAGLADVPGVARPQPGDL